MIKKLLIPVLMMLSFSVNAQLNNSWIDYSKTYFKFKIGSDNICRIPQPVLNAAGLSTVNADNFQLWRNGQQVRIYTSVTGTALGASDYIEFWGEMNTGKADAPLYDNPVFQLADRYSLETDTSVYFLTVNPGGGNLRYTNQPNPAPGAMVPDPFFMRKLDIYYKEQLNRGYGKDLNEYVYSAAYDNGEGYMSADIYNAIGAFTSSRVENLSGLNVYSGAGAPATVSFRYKSFANTDNNSRTVNVTLFNNSIYTGSSTNTSEMIAPASQSFPLTYFQNPSTAPVTVTFTSASSAVQDRNAIATMGFTYPATFNFNNLKSFYFELAASATGNYLLIDNFNYGTTAPVLYDINNGRRYTGDVVSTPGKVKFVLPASADPVRKFILNNIETANINTVSSLTSKTFINYNTAANKGDYIIITNPVLYNDGSGVNNVDLYRQYRSSAAGGSYNAKVYEIAELTDQFGFGIKKHPASIRDFVRYMDQNFSPKPKYILILGRGMTYLDYKPQEGNPVAEGIDLVPTFGWPSSDILMVAEPGTQVPITPVGRVAAINGTELGYYLNKVKEYELVQKTTSPYIADKAWMKDGIHIVGGATDLESSTFSFYMDQYKASLEDTLFGGHIETFKKTSNATVQQASSERISQLFQNGIGFIGYFGHSSANVFEFNLGSPENYNNPGKYPFFNVSGCSAGNLYTYDPQRPLGSLTLSEKYILLNQRGSIGFLADTHFGIPFALNNYNKRLYEDFSSRMYGQGIGDQVKDVTNYLGGTSTSTDWYTRMHLEEINLHGDPAIKINSFPKPDHVIEDQTIKISPTIISVSDPSFNVKVDMRNMGRAPKNDSMRVYIKRILPNTTALITLKDTLIKAPYYRDSLEITVPINPLTDAGQNQLIVEVDYTNRISEIYETNNKVGKSFFIFEDNLRPVYPYNFAIVNTQNITYTASTSSPLASVRPYVMELDTTELFNSPFKKTYNITSAGGALSFTPTNITFTDSTVYYWRTAVVPSNGNYIWTNSSFIYLPASTPGYNMSHYYQHQKSTGTDLSIAADRTWKFGSYFSAVKLRNGVFPTAANAAQDFMVDIDGSDNIRSVCNVNKFIFNAINPAAGMQPMYNALNGSPGQFGSESPCGPTRVWNFQYDASTQASRNSARDFLLNNVPNGWYVTLRFTASSTTSANTYAPVWAADGPNSLYTLLKASGFTDIDSFYKARAFNFIYRKNDNSFTPLSQFSEGISDKIVLDAVCPATKPLGMLESPAFGPAAAWGAFHWRGKSSEVPTGDSVSFKVVGVTALGAETVLFNVDSTMKDVDISSVNATQYPYIKMRMFTKDTVAGTPYQLRYWRLNYTPVPEGAVAPNIMFTMKDTVEIGEPIDFSVAFKNVSQVPFSSLMKISLKIRTYTNYDSVINIPPGKILISGDTLMLRYKIPSQNYPNMNTLIAEFNPNNDQPEQTHFNNILLKNFFVKTDPFNPLLDVTFDGVHILSRDIVASKPNILIKLKDESRFMLLSDTSLLKLQLRYPDQTLRNFYFNNDTVRFTPATSGGSENAATINFRPYLPEDGEYELIVSGKDASGNLAGNLNYHTVFTVINKPMISEMLNYPNPFTTSTAFVFTLTGSRVPSNIRIQILTITGKVVREITMNELGPIHVGRNITEYKWDGTDMYGQKLANGVYLYRVITNLEGNKLDKYKAEGDDTDKYFKKGYGKMYLMR